MTVKDGAPFLKVLDFGISKFEAESGSGLGVTAEGAVMGTPFYMPPEQVRGLASIDLRADVYSLGVILYECSTGVRPYTASTIEQLAVLIHEGKPVPLAERRPGLPRAFCDVIERAMAVDRDQRFQTARALAEALAPFRATRSRELDASRRRAQERAPPRRDPARRLRSSSQAEPRPRRAHPSPPRRSCPPIRLSPPRWGPTLPPPPMAATASPCVGHGVPPPPGPAEGPLARGHLGLAWMWQRGSAVAVVSRTLVSSRT